MLNITFDANHRDKIIRCEAVEQSRFKLTDTGIHIIISKPTNLTTQCFSLAMQFQNLILIYLFIYLHTIQSQLFCTIIS